MAVLVDDLAAAAVKTAARPGLRWRYGPVCLPGEHKAYHTDLETYLGWIAEVESHTHNTSEAAQRIRMVYYSKTAGSRLFDLVLSSEASRLGAPLTLAHAWQPALDGIMGTGELMTGLDGAGRPLPPVDVSHFWVIADRERNGLAPLGEALDLESNAHGGMSWTGDLASWWTSYNDKRLAAMLQARDEGRTWSEPTDPTGLAVPLDWLEQATAARCSRSDLYGDMDAIVLSNDVAQLPLIPGTPISEPISDLLRRYYGPSHIVIPYSQLHADNRFHLFVHRAKPAIPHNYDAGTGQVSLRDEARDVIRSHIQRPLRCLLRVARLWAGKAFFTHFSLAPLADQLAQKGLVALAIEASVEADITSPWGREMLNRVADRFTAFLRQGLAAGGWAGDWPQEPSPLEDYGGFELRLGDNDLARRYGGQANAVSQRQPYVVRLQQRLIDLGFTAVRAADGDFGVRTAIALRELQTEARRDHVYEATPPPAATLVVAAAARRFGGVVNGVLDWETATTLQHWTSRPGARRNLNPLKIQGWTKNDGLPGVVQQGDVWLYDDVRDESLRMYAIDQIQRYPIPPEQDLGREPGMVAIGGWTAAISGGPQVVGYSTWQSATVTPANLLPADLQPADAATASRYRVIRALAEVECYGRYDSLNCYDTGRVSIGLYHWTLQKTAIGELPALLAMYKSRYPNGYARDFGQYGIEPEKPWDPTKWTAAGAPSQAKFAGRLATYGLRDEYGAVRPDMLLALGNLDDPDNLTDSYVVEYLRSWRWVYRFVMALRTSSGLQRVQWDYALLRAKTLLDCKWKKAGAAGSGPVVPDGTGAQRIATFGEVFTSERAVAALLRWHVNRPARVLDSTGAVFEARQAYEAVFGTGLVDLSALTPAEATAKQRALTQKMIDLAPTAAEFRQSVGNAVGYSDPHFGMLLDTAGSFRRP